MSSYTDSFATVILRMMEENDGYLSRMQMNEITDFESSMEQSILWSLNHYGFIDFTGNEYLLAPRGRKFVYFGEGKEFLYREIPHVSDNPFLFKFDDFGTRTFSYMIAKSHNTVVPQDSPSFSRLLHSGAIDQNGQPIEGGSLIEALYDRVACDAVEKVLHKQSVHYGINMMVWPFSLNVNPTHLRHMTPQQLRWCKTLMRTTISEGTSSVNKTCIRAMTILNDLVNEVGSDEHSEFCDLILHKAIMIL